jgi:DNA-binding transcriptional MocR family regulator
MYKYFKIADSIKEEIKTGKLKPGKKLPSINSYAKKYHYNSDTVIKAYRHLESEHLIYSIPKSGYYVVESMKKPEKAANGIDLFTVRPPDSINPYKDLYHCMEKSISIYKNKLMEYASPQGMDELRISLVKHLTSFHIFTKPQDIFITNGAQQALYILSSMPFYGNQAKVVVEQPTYSVMLQALSCNNVPIIGIKRTVDGIDIKELEALFKTGDVKFFYTIPRFQNPTGFSYNTKQKQDILDLASRYGVYIVEDDYLADLELDEKSDSLYAMGHKELVIYIRSFSKTLLPGLRLGMTIVPESLKEQFLTYKQSMDLNTPTLTQGALEIYLKSSMYKAHAARTKRFYKNKMDVLREACECILQRDVVYHIPPTGIYAFIETGKASADKIANNLAGRNILLKSTKDCYLNDFPALEGIRLCVCNCSDEDLVESVKLIKEEILKTLVKAAIRIHN